MADFWTEYDAAKVAPTKMKLTVAEATAALTAAYAAPVTPWSGSTGGCGRAYVKVYGLTGPGYAAVAKACKALGLLWVKEMKALYVGYDNADGRALAKSEAVAAALKAAGWSCYADGESD